MDRAQRVDEKNGIICLVIMFTPRVTVIKMSTMTHFCMSADYSKKSVTVLATDFSVLEKSYLALLWIGF